MNSAFTGKEFFSLPIERQIELLKHGNKVFCRTEPSDKQRLITMLEKLGEVIAMTGTYSLTHWLTHSLTY